jgi:hypothetical protein
VKLCDGFSVKECATCLNAANLWLETWEKEGTPEKGKMKWMYAKEIRATLGLALKYMFSEDMPDLRQDLQSLLGKSRSIGEFRWTMQKFMEVFCYLITVSQDNYIAVHKEDFKMWRKEEETILRTDPTDLILI